MRLLKLIDAIDSLPDDTIALFEKLVSDLTQVNRWSGSDVTASPFFPKLSNLSSRKYVDR
jgi:hypothetical protein